MSSQSVESDLARYGRALRSHLEHDRPLHVLDQLPNRSSHRRAPLLVALTAMVLMVLVATVVVGRNDSGQVPVSPATTSTPTTTRDAIGATDPGLVTSGATAAARLLVADINTPSFTVIDLATGKQHTYPSESHALPPGSITGAELTSQGDALITRWDTAFFFEDADFAKAPVELHPTRIQTEPGGAVDIWITATDDGTRAWIVQPGISHPSLIDLVELGTGEVITHAELDETVFPHPAGDRLVLTTSGPGLQIMEPDGSVTELDETLFAASGDRLVLQSSTDLEVLDLTTGDRRTVTAPEPGEWRTAASLPLLGPFRSPTAFSNDGRMLAIIGQDPDTNGIPRTSSLYAVDLDTGSTTTLAHLQGAPSATWTSNGRVMIYDRWQLSLLEPDGATTPLVELGEERWLVCVLAP